MKHAFEKPTISNKNQKMSLSNKSISTTIKVALPNKDLTSIADTKEKLIVPPPTKKVEKSKSVELVKEQILKTQNISQFPIVGIGASAGGLEALEGFFKNMPENNGMAFVVIQHLDPTRVDIMPEILQRITSMKVLHASDELELKPHHVYVIPPNKSMSLIDTKLHLFDPVKSQGLRLPIDIFFRSLAAYRLEASIGIILSGMGSDGSLGIKAIKEEGGMVLVQEPTTAKFDGMPRSALEAVIADIVAPAEELPDKLINLLKILSIAKRDLDSKIKNKTNLDKIIILLREQSNHDFSLYKKNTLLRRIERRKSIHQIDTIQNYVRFLKENPKEIEILFREMLIGVTNFFRDVALWDELKEKILPELIDKSPSGYVLRAWVAGCSTGEEAYSLAIIFQEVIAKSEKGKNITLQIFATDLDHDAIELARKGYFNSKITVDVSEERIKNYFTKDGNGYRVNSTIREMIVFAPQNMIENPPFTRLDILTCRNVLIYMESELQKKMIGLFTYCLNPNGIIVLGTSETLRNNSNEFTEINNKLKIFKRNLNTTSSGILDFPTAVHRNKMMLTPKSISSKPVENIQTIADNILLQRFSPSSVLVNAKGDIVHISGRTEKYLEPITGKANWNIHTIAREELRHELPRALHKAMQNFEEVKLHNIKIGTNGGTQYVNVTIQRMENPEPIKGMIMIIFTDVPKIISTNLENIKSENGNSTTKEKQLEMQLQQSNEDLQSTLEKMQTSQEELKSSNEELQSTNEELQSTSEELLTSKEEMQSLNEELQTVNIELQNKVNDFVRTNNDMKNLLNSTEIATLFLDKDLNIRRFTDAMTTISKLRSMDIGRPFIDLINDLQYPELDNHAREVLRTLTSIEMSITTNDQRWFNVRIIPYRTVDNRIDGLVITFTNITTAKKLEIDLALTAKEKEETRIHLVETANQLAIIANQLALTAKEKEETRIQLALTAKEKEETRIHLVETANQLALTAKEKEETAKQLALTAKEKEETAKQLTITAKEKEETRIQLAETAKQLTITAKEKEETRIQLAETAKQLAITAKEKEETRIQLAETAKQLAVTANQLAITAKEKEETRIQLAETAKQLAIKNLKKNKHER
jgi:two-component system CheB/CheR fusion protein